MALAPVSGWASCATAFSYGHVTVVLRPMGSACDATDDTQYMIGSITKTSLPC